MDHVVALFGPTAAGKTDVAEVLADRLDGEVVSADAMQVYRGLPILTNQPARRTRLVGIWPLSHETSVVEYARLAHEEIDAVLDAGRTPIVAGGTGLYLRAALADLAVPPAPRPGARERWEAHYDTRGPETAHAALVNVDPAAAAAVHPNDRRRVVRALELAEMGSSLRPASARLWTDETRHPTMMFGLDVARDVLARRIVERNRRMVERGVVEEVREALAADTVSSTAEHIHGLRELAERPVAEALAEMDRQMRRYAAYQRKWMRRIPGIVLVDADRRPSEIAAELERLLAARAGAAMAGRRA